METDIIADVLNADCVHNRWLGTVCPILVMYGALHTVDHFDVDHTIYVKRCNFRDSSFAR